MYLDVRCCADIASCILKNYTCELDTVFCCMLMAGFLSARNDECSFDCQGPSKYSYVPGRQYRHQYVGVTSTQLLYGDGVGARTARSSVIELRADVHIHVASQCQMTLTVSSHHIFITQ